MDVVLRLNREEKMTVLLITHFPEEAMLADRAIVMHAGEIVMEGNPKEVFSGEERLRQYSLALPSSYAVCRMLTERGLPIADSIDEEEIARRILVEISKTQGVGTHLTGLAPRVFPRKDSMEDGRITAENVTHVYNPKSPFETYALNGASLEINGGEFFGIIGYTGSGKSTFVQHLNALIKLPSAEKKYRKPRGKKGNVQETRLTVAGYDLTDKTTDFRALRKDVGMVFQYPEYQLFAETVFEDVAFGLRNFSDKALTASETELAVREAIEMVGLRYEEVKDKSPFELSGGQKRRVAIAGVIVTKPKILVLDEPAAGLDPLGKREIMELLHKLHSEWCQTLIFVSHDMDEIAEHCTKAAAFSGGKVVACGKPKEIFSSLTRVREIGLDRPFTAKLTHALSGLGVRIDSDLSLTDFVKNVLLYAQKAGAGMDITGGGADV
jgi:energy-coupling factor transport system ATP-binding protein